MRGSPQADLPAARSSRSRCGRRTVDRRQGGPTWRLVVVRGAAVGRGTTARSGGGRFPRPGRRRTARRATISSARREPGASAGRKTGSGARRVGSRRRVRSGQRMGRLRSVSSLRLGRECDPEAAGRGSVWPSKPVPETVGRLAGLHRRPRARCVHLRRSSRRPGRRSVPQPASTEAVIDRRSPVRRRAVSAGPWTGNVVARRNRWACGPTYFGPGGKEVRDTGRPDQTVLQTLHLRHWSAGRGRPRPRPASRKRHRGSSSRRTPGVVPVPARRTLPVPTLGPRMAAARWPLAPIATAVAAIRSDIVALAPQQASQLRDDVCRHGPAGRAGRRARRCGFASVQDSSGWLRAVCPADRKGSAANHWSGGGASTGRARSGSFERCRRTGRLMAATGDWPPVARITAVGPDHPPARGRRRHGKPTRPPARGRPSARRVSPTTSRPPTTAQGGPATPPYRRSPGTLWRGRGGTSNGVRRQDPPWRSS